MITLRQKIFFDYAGYAAENGQEAADILKEKRKEIANKLRKAREINNAQLEANIKNPQKGDWWTGSGQFGSKSYEASTIKGSRESAKEAATRLRNRMHNRAMWEATSAKHRAELDSMFEGWEQQQKKQMKRNKRIAAATTLGVVGLTAAASAYQTRKARQKAEEARKKRK